MTFLLHMYSKVLRVLSNSSVLFCCSVYEDHSWLLDSHLAHGKAGLATEYAEKNVFWLVVCAFQEQYFFIHEAIKESLDCGNTEIYAKDLPQALQRLRQPSILDDSITGMQAEFQVYTRCPHTVMS